MKNPISLKNQRKYLILIVNMLLRSNQRLMLLLWRFKRKVRKRWRLKTKRLCKFRRMMGKMVKRYRLKRVMRLLQKKLKLRPLSLINCLNQILRLSLKESMRAQSQKNQWIFSLNHRYRQSNQLKPIWQHFKIYQMYSKMLQKTNQELVQRQTCFYNLTLKSCPNFNQKLILTL